MMKQKKRKDITVAEEGDEQEDEDEEEYAYYPVEGPARIKINNNRCIVNVSLKIGDYLIDKKYPNIQYKIHGIVKMVTNCILLFKCAAVDLECPTDDNYEYYACKEVITRAKEFTFVEMINGVWVKK